MTQELLFIKGAYVPTTVVSNTAFANLANPTNTIVVTSNSVPTKRKINTASPLEGGGQLTTDLFLSIPQADATHDGYLSKEDWSSFNEGGGGDGSGTSSNTPDTVVKRDGSGNFSAGTITANLTGNASTASTATNFSGSLAGDVTGNQGSTVVATVAASSAANIHTAELLANAATAANTANTIVKRDSKGNFNAGVVSASLEGTASSIIASPLNASSYRPTTTGYFSYPLGWPDVSFDPAGRTVIARGYIFGGAAARAANSFNGFPCLEVFPDGRIWVVYSSASSHGGNDTTIMKVISTDGGNTWSNEAELNPVEGVTPVDAHLSCTGLIKSGTYKNRLFLVYWTTGNLFTRLIYSDDFGATWSVSKNCYDTGNEFTTSIASSTPLVAPDGSLLIAQYGHVNSEQGYKCTILRSTNGGDTWSRLSVLVDGTTSAYAPEQFEEPQLLLLNDGITILASIREDGLSSGTAVKGTIRFRKSIDSGATWTDVSMTYPSIYTGTTLFGQGRPNICQFESGMLACITRGITSDYPANDAILYISHDNGVTWGFPRKLDSRALYFAYGDMKNCGKNQIAMVYSTQNAAFSRADVNFTYLLGGDGISPLGGTVINSIRMERLMGGNNASFVTPPTLATSNDATELQTKLNNLISYMSSTGLAPVHPTNISTLTGLWETDTITNNINDLTGTFASNTNLVDALNTAITPTTSGGSWGVTSNQLQNATPSGSNVIYWNVGSADGEWSGDVTWDGNSQAWVICRVVGATTYLLATCDSNTPKLYKNVSGSTTLLASGSSGGFSNGVAKNLKIIMSGATITVQVAGVTSLTHSLSVGDQATFLSPTLCGFYTSQAGHRFDNALFHKDLVDAVSTIPLLEDQSINNLDMTQPTANRRPIYYSTVSGLFNEKPFVRFQGHWMYTAAFASQSQPNAYVGVFFFDTTTSSASGLVRERTGSGNNQALTMNALATYNRKLSLYAGVSGAVGGVPLSINGISQPSGPYVISAYFNGSSSWIRVNGKYVCKHDAANYLGNSPLTQVEWGDEAATGGNFCTTGLAVLAHGSPTLSDIVKVEHYFAQKYGIRMQYE